MQKYNLIRSTLISSVLTTVFLVLITILGELYKVTTAEGAAINPIKDFLKALHGHHWVGKGIWAIGLFVISTIAFYYIGRKHDNALKLGSYIHLLTGTLLIGTILLYGFFVFEYITAH